MAAKSRTPNRAPRSLRTIAKSPVDDENLTIAEVCKALKVARSTFSGWRDTGRAPECIRLPNGSIRVRQSDLKRWLDSRVEAA